MNKKAQVTIFIIAGIVIVAAFAMFFLIRGGLVPGIGPEVSKNPQVFIGDCIEDNMNKNIAKALEQGGFIDPKNYKIYNDKTATYLCEHRGQFQSCINQHPMLLSEISNELKEYIIDDVRDCFLEFENGLEQEGYEIDLGNEMELDLSLGPGNVYLGIKRDITISQKDETSNFDEVSYVYPSKLYDLASVAVDIVGGESQFCYFEHVGYMNINPSITIDLAKLSDSTKIYMIEHKTTKDKMYLAIRGCALS